MLYLLLMVRLPIVIIQQTETLNVVIEAARDEARDVILPQHRVVVNSLGIYAYGEEADWFASLMYYGYNNAEPPSNIRGTTFDTDGYYNAPDAEDLTAAINDIFQKIVQTMGVSGVSIDDGTTSNVSTGTGVAHLSGGR